MNIKKNIVKYMLTAATLIPAVKNAEAKGYGNYQLYYDEPYSLSIRGGLSYILPSKSINSQLGAKELDGACMGGFVEVGAQNWSTRPGIGNSDYEVHFGFSGRFDFQSFNSRAYNVMAEATAASFAGDSPEEVFKHSGEHGFAHVNDFIWTANMGSGIGGGGFVFETFAGVGWHVDNHGNNGPVIAMGTGLGVRITNNMKLNALYRLNLMPYENPGPKAKPANSPGLRNTVEIGFTCNLPTGNRPNINRGYYYHAGRRR